MSDIGTMYKNDLQLFLVTDSVSEGMDYINAKLENKYGAPIKFKPTKRRWWLGER